jgi:hypothetical protein
MTTIFSGDTGASAVANNTVGNNQVIAGSLPLSKLSVTLPFTKEYVSPEQTFTASGLLTLPHSLGVAPKFIQGFLVCKTADQSYAIGDVILVPLSIQSSSAADNFGAQVRIDSANIYVRYGVNPFLVGRATDGVTVQTTAANWRLVVRAWA